MADKVTLVHPTAHPSPYTTSNPTVITQFKSQGYRVVEADEAPVTGYDALGLAALRDEVKARNEGRDDATRITVDGRTKAAHVAALEADDVAQASAEVEPLNGTPVTVADAAGDGSGDGAGVAAGDGGQ